MIRWYRSGETLVTAMPAWYEFVCGPLTGSQEAALRGFLSTILPFEEEQARAAAYLFNESGRKRHLKVDAMIAGCALVAHAKVATDNEDDFANFEAGGLELIRE